MGFKIGDSSTKEPNKAEPKRLYRLPRLHVEILHSPAQYVIIKGGRGGFKTTSIICYMIEESYAYQNCAFLFTREIAKSIEDSVYSVVADMIRQAGVEDDFQMLKKSIVNKRTGVKFLFTGLRATGGKTAMSQINKVKGLHKIRLVFMEEGQDLSEDSLNVLLPTVNRKGGVMLLKERADLAQEIEGARFFVAMNPNKEIDPVVSKFSPFVEAGIGTIAHINMMDIAEDEPELRDDQLINQMELERGEYYFAHVWEGAAFHKFAGLPFSHWTYEAGICDDEIEVLAAWLDPSFKGGDYTAISMIGRRNDTGRVVAFGRAYKSAWNMEPAITGIAQLYRKWGPDRFWFEDNSLGTVPKTILAQHGIPGIGITSVLNKEDKIYKAAAFAGGLVDIAADQCCPVWLKLVKEYSDEADHDDAPDSLASLIVQTGIIKEKLKF